MPQIALDAPRPLPAWLRIVASVAIVVHLGVFAAWVLHAPSGPWITPFGPSDAEGPYFARPIAQAAESTYLRPLRMTHTYRFAANNVATLGVYFEVHLRDDKGKHLKTLKFPDDKALPWPRHRQAILARELTNDRPVQPGGSEVIPAPNRKMETVTIWEPGKEQMSLKRTPVHMVPRDRPVEGPSPWSLLLAQTYMRHLCREHKASSAELVRHTRGVIFPSFTILDETMIPPDAFNELVCNFGEYRREQ